jgi:hypothetical protein
MSDPAVVPPTEPVTIDLSPSHVQRLDELCLEHHMSRSQLVAFLLDQVKPRRAGRAAGRQKANPWGQVWPGGHL